MQPYLLPSGLRDGEVVADEADGVGVTRLQDLLGEVADALHVGLLCPQLLLERVVVVHQHHDGVLVLGQGPELELRLGMRQPLPDHLDRLVKVLGLGDEARLDLFFSTFFSWYICIYQD